MLLNKPPSLPPPLPVRRAAFMGTDSRAGSYHIAE